MRHFLSISIVCLFSFAAPAKQKATLWTNYKHEFSAPANSKNKSALPGILVIPEFWGVGELTREFTRQLNREGFATLTMDLYGDAKESRDSEIASKLTSELEKSGFEPIYENVKKAISQLKSHPLVDSKKLAIVGLGYGGGLGSNTMKSGNSDIKAMVNFYGGVKKVRSISKGAVPPQLYFHPTKDEYTNATDMKKFEIEMLEGGIDITIVNLENAQYGFIHPKIKMYGKNEKIFMSYDRKSAELAWSKMLAFLRLHLK